MMRIGGGQHPCESRLNSEEWLHKGWGSVPVLCGGVVEQSVSKTSDSSEGMLCASEAAAFRSQMTSNLYALKREVAQLR